MRLTFLFTFIGIPLISGLVKGLLSKDVKHDLARVEIPVPENSTSIRFPEELLLLFGLQSDDHKCTLHLDWLHSGHEKNQLPFKISQPDGISLLKGHELNCQAKRFYDLLVTANCQLEPQVRTAHVRLLVTDINQYPPSFPQQSYETNYVEGYGQNYLIKMVAYDQDCVTEHSACGYKILNSDVPFQINSQGLVWPTMPLDGQANTKYEFQVVGIDCTDGTTGRPATLTVNVHKECKARFSVDKSKEFDITHPFRNLELKLCSFCKPVDIVALISLDFDEPALVECEGLPCESKNETTVNIMQSYDQMNVKQPTPLVTYSFNGYDDVIKLDNEDLLTRLEEEGGHIKFWARVASKQHGKRQLLCQSDKSDINRCRFSLYLRDGFLKLMYRQNPMKAPANHEFFPSEWSWNVSDIVSSMGQWHDFDVQIDYPEVELRVDSAIIKHHKVIHEWPVKQIRSNRRSHDTLTTVGACWNGQMEKHVQHFCGDMAGLRVILSDVGKKWCPTICSQRLELDPHDKASVHSKDAVFNERGNVVLFRGSDSSAIRRVLDALKYVEPSGPVPFSVFLNGTIICENTPKMEISDLWLRGTTLNAARKELDGHSGLNPSSKGTAGKAEAIKTTPGFVYSGWMIAVPLTLVVVGVALFGRFTIQRWPSKQQVAHHRCPTDDLEWDNITFVDNPAKLNVPLAPRSMRRPRNAKGIYKNDPCSCIV